jgi:hypothetical protein
MYYPNSDEFYNRVKNIFDQMIVQFPASRQSPFGGKKKKAPKGKKGKGYSGGHMEVTENQYLPSDVRLQNIYADQLQDKALMRGRYAHRQIEKSDDLTGPQIKAMTPADKLCNYPFDEADEHLPVVHNMGSGSNYGYGYSGGKKKKGGNSRASADVEYPYNNGATCGSGFPNPYTDVNINNPMIAPMEGMRRQPGGKIKRKASPWMQHVKALRKKHPNLSMAQALKEASKTYH